ncbi:MAG: teichoic acid transport system permease protein [Thermoleophilaceae bacterium]|jgi:ABC-type polysaccharide/polyol phosphate export permease|nr:teichoic acid transport system permease protein [Thermoleophilaceae bacterium]
MSTETPTAADDAEAAGPASGAGIDQVRGSGRTVEWTAEQHVYEPHRVGLPPLRPYIRELWRRREFAFELSRTNLRAQHFETAFGQAWLVMNPLLLALVYFILVDILRHGHRPHGFFAHLVSGIFAYYFVSGAVRESVKSVTGGGRLVLNTAFPRTLLPLSTVITAFKRFVPTFVIYIPIHLISGLPVGLADLWLIPIVIILGFIAAGVAMFVAALQVYFRDVKSFLPYVLRIWLYASPVLYYPNEIPNHWNWLLKANPIGSPLAAWSDVLQHGHAPPPVDMLVGIAWAVVLFVAGALFFMSREREFAVRL